MAGEIVVLDRQVFESLPPTTVARFFKENFHPSPAELDLLKRSCLR